MILQGMYLKTYDAFDRRRFTVPKFAALHGISPGSSKVLLHRLKTSHQILRTAHGVYVLMAPKTWMTLRSLEKRPELQKLAFIIYEAFPALSLLVLYGSRVRGNADRHSDYDVLVVLDKAIDNAFGIRKDIEKRLGIRLHLTVYSEEAFRIFSISQPSLRFWFKEGIIFDEKNLVLELAKPVAKLGYLESLEEARNYIAMLAQEPDRGYKARYAFTALRISLLVEHALDLDHDYGNVRAILVRDVGASMELIRAGKSLSPRALSRLEAMSSSAIHRVARHLGRLGENESDLLLAGKERWVSMSRKDDLDRIASFLGNAAAHAALLPDNSFARKEVVLYSSDAQDLFMAKHWNADELAYLKEKALARAKGEIRSRMKKYGFEEKDFDRFSLLAVEFVDSFVHQAKG